MCRAWSTTGRAASWCLDRNARGTYYPPSPEIATSPKVRTRENGGDMGTMCRIFMPAIASNIHAREARRKPWVGWGGWERREWNAPGRSR